MENTYKVKATMLIDVEIDIDAEDEDKALSKFYAMDARDVIDDGIICEANSENETAELSYGTFLVKTTYIAYDVGFNDLWDQVAENHPEVDEDTDEFDDLVYREIDNVKKSLPQVLELEVTCEPDDLDDYVADAVSEETGWLVDLVEYTSELKK